MPATRRKLGLGGSGIGVFLIGWSGENSTGQVFPWPRLDPVICLI